MSYSTRTPFPGDRPTPSQFPLKMALWVGIPTTLILLILLLTVGITKIPPGYGGIKVNNWGNQKGPEDFPLRTGAIVYNRVTTDVYEYPTFTQQVVWTRSVTEGDATDESITFNSKEGTIINADVGFNFAIQLEKIPHIFVDYRTPIEGLTHGFLRNQVRDALNAEASKMGIAEIFGEGKQRLLDAARKDLVERLGPKGFVIELLTFTGALRIPGNVQEAINEAIAATQRAIAAENKVKEKEAEAKQKVAEAQGDADAQLTRARAQAEANELLQKAITPLILEKMRVERWNGELPQFVGSGTIPMMSFPATPKGGGQ